MQIMVKQYHCYLHLIGYCIAQKVKFPLRISAVNLVTFTEEILNEKLYFLYSVAYLLNLFGEKGLFAGKGGFLLLC